VRSVCALAVALPLALCGCGGGIPPTHFYVLEPQDVSRVETVGAARGLAIGVETFRVDPPYDQDRIVYRVDGESAEVGFYAYHRWAAPLARMLRGLVVESFRDASEIAIDAAASGAFYDCYLDGTLVRLEELDVGAEQRVRMRLDLTLAASDGTELWSETLEAESSTRADDVREIVAEMARLLGRELSAVRPAVGRASTVCAPAGGA